MRGELGVWKWPWAAATRIKFRQDLRRDCGEVSARTPLPVSASAQREIRPNTRCSMVRCVAVVSAGRAFALRRAFALCRAAFFLVEDGRRLRALADLRIVLRRLAPPPLEHAASDMAQEQLL